MTYTLTYFPIRGRAGHIRLLLEDLKIPYNYKVVQFVPVLQDDNLYIAQSGAIARYLARKHNKYGANETEMALNDMIFEMNADIQNIYVKFIFDEKHNEKKNDFITEVKGKLELVERFLKRRGKTYTVCDDATLADYYLFEILDIIKRQKDDILKEFPHLESLYQRMKSRPNIAAYVQSDRYFDKPVPVVLSIFDCFWKIIPYKQNLISNDEWKTLKSRGPETGEIPFAQLPVLQHGDLHLAQSGAIARYSPEDTIKLEKAQADMLYDTVSDIRQVYRDFIFDENWQAKREKFAESASNRFALLENMHGKQYLIGDDTCFADYHLLEVIHIIQRIQSDIVRPYSWLTAFCQRMEQRSNIAEYLKSTRRFEKPVPLAHA
eukprot:jgi/Galph1/1649/GphlegSOOS_G310.1